MKARRLESSAKGGRAGATEKLPPLGELEDLTNIDVGTVEGAREFLAATIRALARVPFDTRTANSISQVLLAQRLVIDTASVERRLQELEALSGVDPHRR